jgi:nitrogen fixation NifU-like protein
MQTDNSQLKRRPRQQILDQIQTAYSSTALDHGINPRNRCPMDNPDGHAVVTGPCGDTIEFFIQVRKQRIADAGFLTDGCMTSIASGSMTVTLAIGKSIAGALAITPEDILDALGGLPPEGRHCAFLASHALHEAIGNYLSVKREPWKRVYASRPLRR